ncbi:hypothetical protein GCM10023067_59470 [Aminobacter aganoensis]
MPVIVDAKNLPSESAQDFSPFLEPTVAPERHHSLEMGVTERARVCPKTGIGDDAGNHAGWQKGPERHDAKRATVGIDDELLKRGQRIRGDGDLQDPTVAIQQLQSEAIGQQPDGEGYGQTKAYVEDA